MAQSYPDIANRPRVSEVSSLRGRLANAHRRGAEDEIIEVRRDLAMAKIQQYAEKVVAEAPPLTEEQRARLAGLLNGAA